MKRLYQPQPSLIKLIYQSVTIKRLYQPEAISYKTIFQPETNGYKTLVLTRNYLL
jgi:hypothetical protein